MQKKKILLRIRILLFIFIIGLVISGLTAFPLESELFYLQAYAHFLPTPVQEWLSKIYLAIHYQNCNYPFLSYGTDWLAYAHLVIAIAFIGPIKDPCLNRWVIDFGIIACILIFPLAFIAGPIRSIPFYWQLIDCSFGFLGLIPLIWIRILIKQYMKLDYREKIRQL